MNTHTALIRSVKCPLTRLMQLYAKNVSQSIALQGPPGRCQRRTGVVYRQGAAHLVNNRRDCPNDGSVYRTVGVSRPKGQVKCPLFF